MHRKYSTSVHPVANTKIMNFLLYKEQIIVNIFKAEIPEDFVPLKNYFKLLLERTCEKFFLLILLGGL